MKNDIQRYNRSMHIMDYVKEKVHGVENRTSYLDTKITEEQKLTRKLQEEIHKIEKLEETSNRTKWMVDGMKDKLYDVENTANHIKGKEQELRIQLQSEKTEILNISRKCNENMRKIDNVEGRLYSVDNRAKQLENKLTEEQNIRRQLKRETTNNKEIAKKYHEQIKSRIADIQELLDNLFVWIEGLKRQLTSKCTKSQDSLSSSITDPGTSMHLELELGHTSVAAASSYPSYRPYPIYPSYLDYVVCEKFDSLPYLEVSYSDGVLVGSIARFDCLDGTTRVGAPYATCRNDGKWTYESPTCKAARCNIFELAHSLPEEVYMNEATEVYVNSSSELGLHCKKFRRRQLILTGSSKAICTNGKWEFGNVQCIPGCVLKADLSPHLIIESMENHYRLGDYVILSCTDGYKLSSDVQRVMCLGNTWSDDFPNCVHDTN